MASGRQLAEQNLQTFLAWVRIKSDEDFRSMASRGVLSRKEIATECGFAKSALDQNPRIKAALKELETSLRDRGVLPKAIGRSADGSSPVRTWDPGTQKRALDAERLRRLEQENASLRAELAEVKRALSRYAVLQEALAETGRLPR